MLKRATETAQAPLVYSTLKVSTIYLHLQHTDSSFYSTWLYRCRVFLTIQTEPSKWVPENTHITMLLMTCMHLCHLSSTQKRDMVAVARVQDTPSLTPMVGTINFGLLYTATSATRTVLYFHHTRTQKGVEGGYKLQTQERLGVFI